MLPNEIQLSKDLKVSLGTMRKALEQMDVEKIIVRRQGRGTFVRDQGSNETAIRFSKIIDGQDKRIEDKVDVRNIEKVKPSRDEMKNLELNSNQKVWRSHRIRYHDAKPLMSEVVAIPAQLFPKMTADDATVRICALAQSNGILLRDATERISICKAGKADVAELNASLKEPLLKLDRIIFGIDGSPIEWRIAKCRLGDNYYLSHIV